MHCRPVCRITEWSSDLWPVLESYGGKSEISWHTHTRTRTLHECFHRWLIELSRKSLFSSSDAPLCCLPFPGCLSLSLHRSIFDDGSGFFLSPLYLSICVLTLTLSVEFTAAVQHTWPMTPDPLLTSVCTLVRTNRIQWESGWFTSDLIFTTIWCLWRGRY